MIPVAYLVKCPEGDYLVFEKQLGVREHFKDSTIVPLYTIDQLKEEK
jgi:hypothetical protein